MSFQLRPYQIDIVDKARSLMQAGRRRILIQSPTGSGKTALTAHMLGTSAKRGIGSWFIVHRRELIKQSVTAFDIEGIFHGVISAGFYEDPRPQVQIASIQTLARRWPKLRPPGLIVWDECHHVAAASWAEIFKAFPDVFHIGLTATPQRLDGAGLGTWFDEMINGPSVAWLIENGFLSPYRLYAPPSANLSGVHTRMGDFVKSELSAALDKPTITGDAIKHYQRHALGKRAVVFCVSVEHSKHVVAQFQMAGIPAEHVDGETDTEVRDGAITRFRQGTTKVLSNVELFGEGFDLPALEVAILLRPTQSLGLYLQQVGRALRPSPGKEVALILDHAGNCNRFGLPDEERFWALDGHAGTRNEDAGSAVKICPSCFGAQFAGRPSCRYCGQIFSKSPREVAEVAGELVEVDASVVRAQRRQEQGRAETLEDLVKIGRARGYKSPWRWAHHIMQARQAKKLQGVR